MVEHGEISMIAYNRSARCDHVFCVMSVVCLAIIYCVEVQIRCPPIPARQLTAVSASSQQFL